MRAIPPLLFAALLAGCPGTPDLVDVDEVEVIGSLQGTFSCTLVRAGAEVFDLGSASLDGTLETSAFLPDLRTQGCFARTVEAARGDVVQVVLIQQTRYERAQILELNLPIDAVEEGAPLFEDDRLVFVGRGGFGSMYTLDADGDDPNTFARVAGGSVLLADWSTEDGETVAGSFDDLRMGEL